ncbi:hypothetical protein KEM54_003688, partial [Ascosphaera aggregata]
MRRLRVRGVQLRVGVSSSCQTPRPSFSSFRHCQDARRNFTILSRAHGNKKEPKVEVNFFEQATPRSKERIPHDFYNESKAEQEEVITQIQKLRKELDIVKLGPFAPNSPLMRSLPDNERKIIEDIVKKYEAEHPETTPDDTQLLNDAMDEFVADSRRSIEQAEVEVWKPLEKKKKKVDDTEANPLSIELEFHEDHKAYLLQMNKSLQALRKESTPATRREAMRFYRRCRESIPGFVKLIPDEALGLLWKSQMMATDEERRLARVLTLADDIISSGKKFTHSQWLDYIQLLFDDGRTDTALQFWRHQETSINVEDLQEEDRYWKLGVKLLIANKELAEARAIVFRLISPSPRAPDYRILIPLIIG